MSQSLTSDETSGADWIEPFFCYYPERGDLNRKQSACYKRIKSELDNGRFVDIGSSKSYIFLYINETLKKVKKKKDIISVITTLELLRSLYKDRSLTSLIIPWLADAYVIKEDFTKAMEIYRGGALWSIKYKLKLPVTIRELYLPDQISKIKGFTGFVRDKYDMIEEHIDILCKRDGLDKDWFEGDWIQNKIEEKIKEGKRVFREYPLFVATRYGYHLNQLNTEIKFIDFHSLLDDKTKIEKTLSREAENFLRLDMGVPKVGQGWRNETELYYRVKKFLPQLS